MQSALESLPWVEKGTVVTDIPNRKVRFALNDKSRFSMADVKRVIADQGHNADDQPLEGP